jgi:ATP adenylyltransferase
MNRENGDGAGMNALWAPWRMEYILGPKDGECFLCAAASGGDDRAHRVVRRGAACFGLLNRYPYNNGHLLIAPYRHVRGLDELNDVERLELMNLADELVRALREAVRPDGFNLGLNLGKVAGAGLETHLHLHVVPRWNGDTNFMPIVAGTKVIPQALDELWERLRR